MTVNFCSNVWTRLIFGRRALHVIVWGLLFLNGSVLAQTTVAPQVVKVNEKIFVTEVKTPVRIGYFPVGAYFTIENHSNKRIVLYRLGCVAVRNEKYNVLKEQRGQAADLPPVNEETSSVRFAFIRIAKLKRECVAKRSRVGITEVTFQDNTSWRIDRDFHRETRPESQSNQNKPESEYTADMSLVLHDSLINRSFVTAVSVPVRKVSQQHLSLLRPIRMTRPTSGSRRRRT